MRRDQLEVGDVVRIDKDGDPFDATITAFTEVGITFTPIETWPTWRSARFREVKERIDPPLGKRHRRHTDEQRAQVELYPTNGRKVLAVTTSPQESAAAPS
jgi:hypothetical protein